MGVQLLAQGSSPHDPGQVMPVLHMGSSLNQGPFRVLFKRVPYYTGDLKLEP